MITRKIFFSATGVSLIAFLAACGGAGGGGTVASQEDSLANYLTSKEIRSDLDNLAEFAYYAEYFKAAPIAMMATDDGLYTRQVDSAEFDEYFELLAEFSEKQEEYEAAWARIDSMQALVSETPKALEKNGVGLAYSFGAFCYSLWHTGAEMREKSMARIGQLDDRERQVLFKGLSSNLKKGETDYKTWWRKFNQGEFDKASAQIYNNFMHNGESSFMDDAETITKVVADKGTDLVEKGGAFETEVLKTVLPDPVTDAMEKIETAEKVTTVVVKGKDMSPEELKNNLLNLVDGYEDAEKVVKMTVGYVEEKSTNADNYEEKGASVINFTDLGRSLVDASKLVSVAVNEKTGKTTIALGGNEDGKPEIVVKEEGKHLLSFFTEIGDKYTQELSVVAGKLYELMGEMNEKAIRDSASKAQVQNSSASGLFNKSSDSKGESSTSGKSSSSMASPFTRSSSSFAANTDSKSIVGKWKVVSQSIDHEITDMEACYAIFGDEEDNSFAEEECVDKEVPVDYSIGEQLLFYSDGTADHINKKGDNDGSYDYSFDKMTSSFAYTDDDGNLAMAQVSTDGETLSVQVVSELPYMRITYKLVLKKVSDDIE